MIISPPFLPPRAPGPDDDENDARYVRAAMPGGDPGEGSWPVSFDMNWHGGRHFTAPSDAAGAPLPVRAIADGTVVYLRDPTPEVADPANDLNYRGGWTNDGCVIILHQTEIGTLPKPVVFLSIYMHLGAIAKDVTLKKPIYRKDEIGAAGKIYGIERQIHLEIICDDDNLKLLVGRTTPDMPPNTDGRTEVVFGTQWFFLPVGTPFLSSPTPFGPNPPTPPAAPITVFTSTEPLWVGMTFRTGDCFLQTYRADAQPLGAAVRDPGYEYDIYSRAHTLYPNAHSAGWELLRFGRVIGPDALPANALHWRSVSWGAGEGWVNLNASGIKKFSDADFPLTDQWWAVIDGSSSKDSRCTDPAVRSLLDTNGDLDVSPAEWNQALSNPSVQGRLAHKICKFQTEWDDSTVDKRYAWLVTELVKQGRGVSPRFSAQKLAKFTAHVKKLCFWSQAKANLSAIAETKNLTGTHWHFDPRSFITQFRKCGWFSANELAQFIPRQPKSPSPTPWATALTNAGRRVLAVNTVLRKYNLLNATRQVHFLAQVYTETGVLVAVSEGGAGSHKDYDAFYGRGLMQLTWLGNYKAYGQYRQYANVPPGFAYHDARITQTSTHAISGDHPKGQPHVHPMAQWFPRYDPEIVASDPFAAGDSGGFYWVSKPLGGRHLGLSQVADGGLAPQNVGDVSVLVNGGANGFDDRQRYCPYIARYRMDGTEATATLKFTLNFVSTYTRDSQGVHPSWTSHVSVDFTAQRP